MADDPALRKRRSRLHRLGDHSLCRSGRCDAVTGTITSLRSVSIPSAPPSDRLAAATLNDLKAIGCESSVDGVAALQMAELLDKGGHSGQAHAALVKAHHEALARAVEGTGQKADVIDVIFGMA